MRSGSSPLSTLCLTLGVAVLFGPGAASPCAFATAHDASVSHSRCRLEGARAELELRFQTQSLLEALPELDADGDGRFTAEELAAANVAVEPYLLAHWELLPPPFQGSALPGRLLSLGFAEAEELDQRFQWIDARLEFEAPVGESTAPLADLVVHSELFTERDLYHRDFLELTYADENPWQVLFGRGEHRWHFRAAALRRPLVRRENFAFGWSAALHAWALPAALLALVVAARSPRAVLGLVALSAFATAAGIAWSVAHWNVPPLRFVRLALPLAAAYPGAETLLRRRPRLAWIEALVFGLGLGLVAAGERADDWEGEPLAASAGLGLWAAYALALLVAGLVLATAARLAPGERPERALAPRWLLIGGSALGALAGLVLFVARTGWLG